jgi:hypothetical protein
MIRSLIEIGLLVLEKIFSICIVNMTFSFVAPPNPCRKLSCEYELFWLSGS